MPLSERMTASLPLPPSSNHIYRVGFNRNTGEPQLYLTKEARAYRKEVHKTLMAHACECPQPPFNFGLHFRLPDLRRRDLSNGIKLLEDSVFGYFGHDDTHVHGMQLWKYIDRKEPGVTIEVRSSTREIDITQ